ncbi:MAG: hypothetical protein ABJH68_08535 [Ilumatobacter sp.]|uniref:hypothetical protein n=1 Tax=Ilumatobacter sp. TaxID=1967498 RepID=UPI0032976A2D
MTASAERRRRSTLWGGVVGLVAVIAVVAVGVVSFTTLRSSEEGTAPEVDVRDSVVFPSTPNAVVAVVDDLDRLTSIAVFTLDPSGAGGSIVAVPVNADQTNSFGPERRPISRQPYTPGDEAQQEQLLSEIEPLLTLTIERAVVAGPAELTALLEPLGDVVVDLPQNVVDSDTPGSGRVAVEGERELDTEELVEAFTAIDADGPSYSHHEVDAALWAGVASAAGVEAATVPLDDLGRPDDPVDFDDFWSRLLGGEVSFRDIAIDVDAARRAENSTDSDFVLVDRRDALLVFGSVSPGQVSKPNESLSFSLVVGFTDDQVAVLGEDLSGRTITKASMTRSFIGEMLFAQANVVSVALADDPASIPDVTRIEIADARFEADVRAVSERFFGDAEVVVATTLTDGIDAVVILGADFLEQRADLLRIEREAAATADASTDEDDGGADFDVSDEFADPLAEDGDVPSSDAPTGDDGAALDGDDSPSNDDESISTDTVTDDE